MSEHAQVLPAVPSKTDLVYELLCDEILKGESKPGDRLSMDGIARRLGVSKIPVREAMLRLESKGLVSQHAHAGPVVARLDAAELDGVYLTRRALDGLIADLVGDAVGAEQLESLRKLQGMLRHSHKRDDIARMWALDQSFHLELAGLTGFGILQTFTEMVMLAVRQFRVTEPLSDDDWTVLLAEHDELLDAFERSDREAAVELARAHALSPHDRPAGKHASWHRLSNIADNIAAEPS